MLFEEGALTSAPRGSGPTLAEAERCLKSWGSQVDLTEIFETGISDRLRLNGPDDYGPGQLGADPRRAVHTSEYGARLSSVPSGDRSFTPATLGASGHSDLQRVLLSASARKRSGPERLATSKNMLKTA